MASVRLAQDSAVAAAEADVVFGRILAWASAEEAVRLVVVTSTRARLEGPPDELSDYDVIVALDDLARFDAVAAYGTPAASWGDEHDVHGVTASFRGVVYEDGVKVDWMLWPVSVPSLIAELGLTDKLDVGYRVLLDKDGATQRWAEPTFRAHIPAKPTEREYVALVEEFWWSATYIAKGHARGQEFYARFVPMYDVVGVLLRMLEWLVELDRDWRWKPGKAGRDIEAQLPSDLAGDLLAALDSFPQAVALFRRVANEVGARLGYSYPQLADDAVTAYFEKLGQKIAF
jgi:aminoglycoside 6-adenylyltransferase